ncbi:MAG: phage Gp37/Gp68 family protein [Devosia marina]|uniref:phage Gp37/Gp68 family protein n=1 Tax=Devosia marina TaxID=2683198 RepID=UPI0032ED1963
MAETSAIEWTDSTFNPWIGCTKISPACDHCYAEALMDKRHGRVKWGGERSRTSASNWQQPRRWQKQAAAFFAQHGRRRRVFCSSLADVFDNQVPDEWRADLWTLIYDTPDLDWLLLTKRPQNIGKMLPAFWEHVRGHVWFGTTVEDQQRAAQNIHHLLQHNAAVHFASCEPLLGPMDLKEYFHDSDCADVMSLGEPCICSDRPDPEARLDWVIAGGESGPQARPSHPDWFRSLRDQCAAAGVPFLFKQWGEWSPRGPESFGYPIVDGVPQFRMSDTGDNGSDLAATGGNQSWLNRAGKKRAGRLLDGVEHNGFPVSP